MDTPDKIEIEKHRKLDWIVADAARFAIGYDAERIKAIARAVDRRYADAVSLLAHDLYRIYTKTDDPLWKAGQATMAAYMEQARRRLAACS